MLLADGAVVTQLEAHSFSDASKASPCEFVVREVGLCGVLQWMGGTVSVGWNVAGCEPAFSLYPGDP